MKYMASILRTSEAYVLAFHALLHMTTSQTNRPVSVAWMAEKFQVSEAHLAKVLQRLAKMGLLVSKRGIGGGFLLGRRPEEITLLDVFIATEGPLAENTCLLKRQVCTGGGCVMSDLLRSVYEQVRQRLSETKLSDLIASPLPAAEAFTVVKTQSIEEQTLPSGASAEG